MMGFFTDLQSEAAIIQQQDIALFYIFQQFLSNKYAMLIAQLWIQLAIQNKSAAFTELNLAVIGKAANTYLWSLHIAENTHRSF